MVLGGGDEQHRRGFVENYIQRASLWHLSTIPVTQVSRKP